jgi:hypothetical protein
MLARFEQPVKVCCGTSVISDQVMLQKRCGPDVVIQHSESTIKLLKRKVASCEHTEAQLKYESGPQVNV